MSDRSGMDLPPRPLSRAQILKRAQALGAKPVAKAAGFTAGADDRGSLFVCAFTGTLALAAAATLGAGWSALVYRSSGTITIDPSGAETINGQATLALSTPGAAYLVVCDGSAFVALMLPAAADTLVAVALSLSSTLKLGTFTVAGLPSAGTAGRFAFATNGRKNGEGGGAGTGVAVFDDGTAWRAVDTGATVAA